MASTYISQGILAAQLLALQALVDGGEEDVGLLYVVSEETDHSGMIKANELGESWNLHVDGFHQRCKNLQWSFAPPVFRLI